MALNWELIGEMWTVKRQNEAVPPVEVDYINW